jgi:hypothetical protein
VGPVVVVSATPGAREGSVTTASARSLGLKQRDVAKVGGASVKCPGELLAAVVYSFVWAQVVGGSPIRLSGQCPSFVHGPPGSQMHLSMPPSYTSTVLSLRSPEAPAPST